MRGGRSEAKVGGLEHIQTGGGVVDSGFSWGVLGLLGLGLLVALATGAPTGASAQLSVRTLEHGAWAATVASLQTDRASPGRVLHVVVEDDTSRRSACGHYRLALDAAGQRAFRVGACDGATAATELQLVDRAALFAVGDVVAHPLSVGISATDVRTGAAAGRAAQPADADLACTVAVRPYLVDLLTGARVQATPDRFDMRPVGQGVLVRAVGDAWAVQSASVTVEYEVVDRRTGEVVLHETASLSCGNAVPPEQPVRQAAVQGDVVRLTADRVFRGATITRGPDDHGSCGGQEGPEQWYVVHLPAPRHLGLRLVSEFDATLYMRQGSIDGPEVACRDDSARLETIDLHLEAGTYYVAVDGTGTHGRYRLMSFETAPDPRAFETDRGAIEPQEVIEGALLPAISRHSASCGGVQAPDHVYTLRIDRPSRVWIRLRSRFDATLYLREVGGVEVDCASVLGALPTEVRASRVRGMLAPGHYQVIVDGYGARSGTGAYRLDVARLPLDDLRHASR